MGSPESLGSLPGRDHPRSRLTSAISKEDIGMKTKRGREEKH
jgi:hypothetical protein